MDKLQKLISLCKCGVFISINEHHDYYQTAEEMLIEQNNRGTLPAIAPEIYAKMVELNTIVNIHFYPDTPIRFYEIYHYDLDVALTQALDCLGV